MLASWTGDLPVSAIPLLPANQQQAGTGYIGSARVFEAVWKAMDPGKSIPDVDFHLNMVLFSRNTQFYNRTRIFKVWIDDGAIEAEAMETMSAIPIGDKVAIALAVIPRRGVQYIKLDGERVPVE